MTLSFWLMIFGVLLTFFGTLLLIFSLPASFKEDPITHKLFITISTPFELFYERVITSHDYSVISALILLVIGVIFQISSVWLDMNPDYSLFLSRILSLLGVAISFLGTSFMIYGGTDAFIFVKKAEDGQYSLSAPVMAAKDNNLDYEESRKKNIETYKYIERRLRINKLGIWFLFIGFMVQLLAILPDP